MYFGSFLDKKKKPFLFFMLL